MGKRVFVSYARTDAARVTAECDTLGAAGFSLWRDDRIEVGTDWRDEIAAAIERCDALLYFVSPASAQSDVCINEIDLALQLRKPVYALHIEPTVLPTRLSFRVGGRQAILAHLLEPSVYRARLIAAIGGERTDESTGFEMPRIAVVPFESIDPDSPHGWLGRRLAISISSLLHRSGRFDVVPERDLRWVELSRASVQDVRRELGCEYLLEGSMHIADDQMSLDVTLTDTKQSRRLWTRIFSEPLSRVINMETRLVTQLAGALEMAAGLDNIDRGTTNSEAYIAYLEGTPVVSDDARSLFKSIECLKRATRLDPRFGEAFVSLASSYYFAADRLNRPELVQQAFEHYRRAIDVGGLTIGNKAWAVWTTCTPRIAGVYEWDRAETALREAMSQRDAYERWFSDPIEPVRAPLERGYAIILSAAGLFAEAAAFAEIEDDRVRIFHSRDGRDPQGISQRWVPLQYANAREWQKAGAYLDEDLRRRPEQIEILVRRAEWYLIPTGRLQEARESLDTFDVSTTAMQRLLGEQATADDARRAIVGVSAPARIRLAFAEGDVATASDLIKRHGRGDLLGLIGDIEGMVHYFEQHPRGAQLVRAALLGATNADELCQHPRYVALLERFKLDEPWQRELSRRVELLAPITGVRATTLRDQVSSAS